MHIFVLVITLFFADPKIAPRTASVIAPSAEACVAGGQALAQKFAQDKSIVDYEFGCFDVTNRAARVA